MCFPRTRKREKSIEIIRRLSREGVLAYNERDLQQHVSKWSDQDLTYVVNYGMRRQKDGKVIRRNPVIHEESSESKTVASLEIGF